MLPAAADSVGPSTGSVGGTTTDSVIVPVRPLQFRELLDLPFALLQARIKPLARVAAVAVAGASAIAIAATVLISVATRDSDDGVLVGAIIATLLCAWVVRLIMRGVTVPMGLAVVHRRPLDRGGAFARLSEVAGPVLGYQVMFTLIGIGVLALGTPLMITLPLAVLWLAWLRARRSLTLPVIFDDSAPYKAATARSRLLTGGTEWQLVGVWLYLRALMVVLLVPLFALWNYVSDISGTRRWTVTVLIITISLLMIAFAEMVESAAQVVAYVDRRCRREAWDIRVPGQARP
ncbi:MYXO-CTERM sorting domain-containing protein [Nocardia sp. NPDC005978]|uniref:MYXO-CTERM sorting domain-containing protein n=1 Tax=unclassified Nocardia TaxID=2637762 RepID=UPI0033B79D40